MRFHIEMMLKGIKWHFTMMWRHEISWNLKMIWKHTIKSGLRRFVWKLRMIANIH